MKKHAPLAALLTLCVIALGVRWLILTKGSVGDSRPRPEKVLSVHQVSIALSNYVAEHGRPELGADANCELTRLLLADSRVQDHHVAGGQLLDDWGTPYAIFLCDEPGEFADRPISINGREVRPVQGIRPLLMHQIISAGPDREFGTEDDIGSWQAYESSW